MSLEKGAKYEEICAAMKDVEKELKVFLITEDAVVSSDFIMMQESILMLKEFLNNNF